VEALSNVLDWYAQRSRRFGMTTDQLAGLELHTR
jgi:hypothetical protein